MFEFNKRRFRNITLLSTSDPGYLQYMSQQATMHMKLGEKEPTTAAQQLSVVLEREARIWLGHQVSLMEERILAFEKPDRSPTPNSGYGWEMSYREIDAVECEENNSREPRIIYEVKATQNPSVLRDARGQLGKSLAILHRKWPHVRGIVICMKLGSVPIEEWQRSLYDVPLVARFSERCEAGELPCLILLAQDVLGNLLDDPALKDLWNRAAAISLQSELNRNQRRLLKEQGVQEADWPAELRSPKRRDRKDASYHIGVETKETAMELEIRRAFGKRSPKDK